MSHDLTLTPPTLKQTINPLLTLNPNLGARVYMVYMTYSLLPPRVDN